MAPRGHTENVDTPDTQSGCQRRPSEEILASIDPRLLENEPSDNEEYEPSNDDEPNPPRNTETSSNDVIDPFDFVSKDHPLRPSRKICILDKPRQLWRFRNHTDFWWDVLLAMYRQAKMNMNQEADRTLREEVIRQAEENRVLRRERDQAMEHEDIAERKLADATKTIEKLRKEREQDQLIISHLGSKTRTTQSRRTYESETDIAPPREATGTSRLSQTRREIPHFLSSTPGHLHNNPKFPDAPVFSGDRSSFEAWKDKVRDKLDSSPAQYPTEQHRIQYIRSRTEGTAYEQIRAQSRPEHPRPFRTSDEMLQALDKIYGDKNKRTRAINELRILRMGRKPFDDFYVDFARCAAEIGYADDAMIPLLENAISDELARQVIGLRKPSDYYELVDFYREIDHQMRDYDKRTANRFRGSRTAAPPEQSRHKTPTQAIASRKDGYFPSSTDRALLSQHGRCFRCGEHGHRIGNCTNPQMKEMPRLFARATSKVNEATVDTDDESTVVEGKDQS